VIVLVDNSNIEFGQQTIKLSGKYNFIIFPLGFPSMQKLLKDVGYKPTKLPEGSPPLSMVIDGEVATKENLRVDCQIEKQVFGVVSKDIELLISSFNEIEEIMSTELGDAMSNNNQFYEVISQFTIKTDKNPLEIFAQNRERLSLCDKVSEIMDENVSPFGFSFSPTRVPIQSADWFDFKLEPLVSRATTSYYGNLVYRSKDRKKVIEKTKNVKNYFISLLKELEST